MATSSRKRKPPQDEGIRVKGMFRVQIREDDGTVVGDTGDTPNVITNLGYQNYLCALLGGTTGSNQVGFLALGTGTLAGAADTGLSGEISGGTKRQAVTVAVSSTSKSVLFTGTFSSGNSFLASTSSISNIGLFASSAAGTLFAGNTYASSTCATNQNVNASYSITFS